MRITTAEPLDLSDITDSARERFWSRVNIAGPDDCWEWTGSTFESGYGRFCLRKGVSYTASRASLAMVQPIPARVLVCHTCDNPPCVNPAHLYAGTHSENRRDCVTRGRARHASGEQHRDARFTAAQVAYIRSQDLDKHGRKTELARQFGVSLTAIRRIANGVTWKDVA